MCPNTYISLELEPLSAILARVAYRVIERDYHYHTFAYSSPAHGLVRLSGRLQRDGFRALSTWVSAYAAFQAQGVTTARYKQLVVRRARWAALNRAGGKPWARVPAR